MVPRKLGPLTKKVRRGFRGYPLATIAYYGPDRDTATKVAVGIVQREDAEPEFMERWFNSERDVRRDVRINHEVIAFVEGHHVKSVVMTDGIIGCPHEEGTDYPEGGVCPKCPFWVGRDRWSGEVLH
jgi:hypothetical protein